ncbi:carboxymuconolactone decarboxylase family protein [Sneathiella limimaris]|uniref:carboxymuconolactone decarboxylase family protein n=1 Tax=Sneathiella limimaris TaxID=1964213 RepID=UPI00146E9FE2|nr:carboxymuconolactone decarboxylase family protein [Sneathiella limimaris]
MSNPLTPLTAPFSAEIEDMLAPYPRVEGYLLSLFRTFANSKRFLKNGVPNLLDKESPLPLRIREIAIHRITARYRCEYEWGIHAAVFQQAAGFSDTQLRDLCRDKIDPAHWTPEEYRLIRCLDTLIDRADLSKAEWLEFTSDWSREQQLELINLVGAYHTVSMVANVAKLPNETFAKPFPDRLSATNK